MTRDKTVLFRWASGAIQGLSLTSQDRSDTVVASRILIFLLGLGFLYGAFIEPVWLYTQYFAQLISGLSHCAPDSPPYLLHGASYTLLTQIPAILLRMGLSAWTLNLLFGGLFSALAYAAVGMATLALSRLPIMAIVMPMAMMDIRLLPDHFYAVRYPVDLSIFGIVAMFFALLIVAFCALGFRRRAIFLMGLAPAIHPSWAIAVWILVPMLLWLRQERIFSRENITDLLLGFSIFVCSFGAHLLWIKPESVVTLSPHRVASMVELWQRGLAEGNHQQMILGSSTPIRHALYFFLPEVTLALLAWFSLKRTKPLIEGPGALLLKAQLIFTLMLVLVRIGHELFIQHLPWQMDYLLYHRWLNLNTLFNILLIATLLVRLAWVEKNLLARFALLVLSVLYSAAAINRNHLPITPCFDCDLSRHLPHVTAIVEGVLLLFFALVLLSTRRERVTLWSNVTFPPAGWRLAKSPHGLLVLVLVAYLGQAIHEFRPTQIVDELAYHLRRHHIRPECLSDWPSVQAALQKNGGMLLLGMGVRERAGINKTLLYRFPLCVQDLPAGGHPYSPASLWKAGEMNRDLMCGAEDGLKISWEGLRRCWQSLDLQHWQDHSSAYGIQQIWVDDRWSLALPPLLSWCGTTLYALPRRE